MSFYTICMQNLDFELRLLNPIIVLYQNYIINEKIKY